MKILHKFIRRIKKKHSDLHQATNKNNPEETKDQYFPPTEHIVTHQSLSPLSLNQSLYFSIPYNNSIHNNTIKYKPDKKKKVKPSKQIHTENHNFSEGKLCKKCGRVFHTLANYKRHFWCPRSTL